MGGNYPGGNNPRGNYRGGQLSWRAIVRGAIIWGAIVQGTIIQGAIVRGPIVLEPLKAEAYLEPKQASMMKLFLVNNLLFLQKKLHHMVDSVLKRPQKIMKFSRRNLGGGNHRDC